LACLNFALWNVIEFYHKISQLFICIKYHSYVGIQDNNAIYMLIEKFKGNILAMQPLTEIISKSISNE
jgi:hypothetical protein